MKKISNIMYLFAVILMLGNTFHGIANAEAFMLGNVNGDGGITAKDALGILKKVVGIEQGVFNADMADCDGDRKLVKELIT